jgi:hypothetical protein
MHRFSTLLLAGMLAVLVPSILHAQSQLQQKLSISQMFPSDSVNLEFLQLVMTKRGTELATKLSKNTDPQWLANYVAKVSEPGKPLPCLGSPAN